MSCPLAIDESAELIVGYGAGILDPAAAAAFERHIEFCPVCCKAVAAQKAVWAALDEWHAVPVSPDFDQKLFQQIAEVEGRNGWAWRVLKSAAAAACRYSKGVFVEAI
jgi:anti-sigma factor RsiW